MMFLMIFSLTFYKTIVVSLFVIFEFYMPDLLTEQNKCSTIVRSMFERLRLWYTECHKCACPRHYLPMVVCSYILKPLYLYALYLV